MLSDVNRWYFTRGETIHRWIQNIAAGRPWRRDGDLGMVRREKPWIRALEVGRIRWKIETSGHSTLHIAAEPKVECLVSMDIAPKTEAVCKEFLPKSILDKVFFVTADALKVLAGTPADAEPFHFIYLDSLNDAKHNLTLLKLCLRPGISQAGTILVIDDTDHPGVQKGDLAVPWAKKSPLVEIVESIPRDRTCQGLTVMRRTDRG